MKRVFKSSAHAIQGICAIGVLFTAQSAQAFSNFTPGDLSQFTNSAANALLQTIGIGADHRAYMPASPLGIAVGLDVGLDFTGISIPQQFIDALVLATQRPASDVPTLIPLPKLNIHKGLPFGVDVGFSYSSYLNYFSLYGGEVKWAFLQAGGLPVVAIRASATYDQLWFLSNHTYKLDLIASKSFIVLEPYLGGGMQFWSGDLYVPQGGSAGLPASVSSHQSGTSSHFFGGLVFKLLIARITGEVDYSSAGITTYGAKFAISF